MGCHLLHLVPALSEANAAVHPVVESVEHCLALRMVAVVLHPQQTLPHCAAPSTGLVAHHHYLARVAPWFRRLLQPEGGLEQHCADEWIVDCGADDGLLLVDCCR